MDDERKPRFKIIDRRTPRAVKVGDKFAVPTGPASVEYAVVERVDELGVHASLGSMKLLGRFGLVHDIAGEYSGQEMWLWEEMRPPKARKVEE